MKKQNDSLVSLTKILSDGNFHNGNELGEKLGITRSAVWKGIKKLKTYGVTINSTRGKGYYLADDLILYERAEILKQLTLSKQLMPQLDLKIFASIPSTNDYLKEINLPAKIAICLAEQQTNGRGRFSRHWYSPFGQNVYLSIGLNFSKDIGDLMGVSLVVGLAVLKAIKAYGIEEKIYIKWPKG